MTELTTALEAAHDAKRVFGNTTTARELRLADAVLSLATLAEEVERLRKENATMRDSLTTARQYQQGEYWKYQGDGEDHLESLVCPVMIQPQELMELQAEVERLRKALQNLYDANCTHPMNSQKTARLAVMMTNAEAALKGEQPR